MQIAKQMPKHFANETYWLACKEPYLWMRKAQELKKSADALWSQFVDELTAFTHGAYELEHFTGNSALMLYGLSIENLLKAGVISKSIAAGENGNFSLKSHDLPELAKDFELNPTPNELELLKRLQSFIEWAGRYPIPLYRDGLYPRKFLDGSQAAPHGIGTSDGEKIEALFIRILALLPTENDALEAYVKSCISGHK